MSTYELAWGEEYTGKGKPPGGGRWSTARVAIARHDDDDLLLLILLECKDGLTMKLHSIERSLHDVSVENFGGVVSLTGPAFHVPFHTKDPQKLELSHAFIKTLNAAKEGRVVASHVPRAAALKQALADEHQRKTELLKKQKRAGGLPGQRRPSSSLNPAPAASPALLTAQQGIKPKSFYGKNYSAQQSLFGAKSRGAALAHAGQTGMAVARSAPVQPLPPAAAHDPLALKPPGQRGFGGEYSRPHGSAPPPPPPAAAARPASLGGGFRNTGNTCYINAVLSAVLGLRPFVRDLLTAPLFTQLSPKLPNLSVFRSLYDLSSRRAKTAAAAAASSGGTSGPTRPLKEAIAQRCSQFAGGGQQDAHEFLVDMIDALHEELLAASAAVAADEITPPLGAAAPLPPPPPEASLPTALNFSCEVEHVLRCTRCSHEWTRPELLRDVQLDLPPAAGGAAAAPASVDRMLESFFAEEPLEVACEKCGHNAARVRHRVSRLPRVLVLQLKRFEYGAFGVRKRTDAVRCTPTVDLGFCCKPEVQPPPPLTAAPMPKPSPAAASAAAGSRPTDGATRRILDFNQRSPMAPPARSPLPPSSAGRGAARGAPGSVGKLNVERVGGGSPSAAGRGSGARGAQRAGGVGVSPSQPRLSGAGGILSMGGGVFASAGAHLAHDPGGGRQHAKPLGASARGGGGGQAREADAERRARHKRQREKEEDELQQALALSLSEVGGGGGGGGGGVGGGGGTISLDSDGEAEAMDEEAQIRRAVELSLRDSAQKQKPEPEAAAEPEPAAEPAAEPAPPGTPAAPWVDLDAGGSGGGDAAAPAAAGAIDLTGSAARPSPGAAASAAGGGGGGGGYQLASVVWHVGSSAGAGHYVADVRVGGEWQRFNDDMVQPVTEREVLHGEGRTKGYLYFYVHEGLAGA